MAIIRPRVTAANIIGTLANSQLPVISTSNLPTIDYSKVPAGTVIQVSHQRHDPNNDNYDLISSGTKTNSPLVATFTPRFANSKIYISSRLHTRVISALGIHFGISRDGVDLDGMNVRTAKDFFYKGDQVNHHYTGHCEAFIDANNTSTSTYRIWANGWDGSTWELSYGHGEHCITFMEIKQ